MRSFESQPGYADAPESSFGVSVSMLRGCQNCEPARASDVTRVPFLPPRFANERRNLRTPSGLNCYCTRIVKMGEFLRPDLVSVSPPSFNAEPNRLQRFLRQRLAGPLDPTRLTSNGVRRRKKLRIVTRLLNDEFGCDRLPSEVTRFSFLSRELTSQQR
jgi:hypothetical protein